MYAKPLHVAHGMLVDYREGCRSIIVNRICTNPIKKQNKAGVIRYSHQIDVRHVNNHNDNDTEKTNLGKLARKRSKIENV